MRARPATFSPRLRFLAAAALSVWVVAQVCCFAHCNFGFRPELTEQAACQTAAPQPVSRANSCCPKSRDNSTPSSSIVCSTLKSSLMEHSPAALVPPDLHLFHTLAPLTLDVTAAEPTAVFFRQTQSRDWVFTPWVCLDPASRSHAPPFAG